MHSGSPDIHLFGMDESTKSTVKANGHYRERFLLPALVLRNGNAGMDPPTARNGPQMAQMKRQVYIARGENWKGLHTASWSKRMFGHEIIVIGASVGGVDAVPRLIASLPAALPASVFVVLHTAPHGPGLLPHIIRKTSAQSALIRKLLKTYQPD